MARQMVLLPPWTACSVTAWTHGQGQRLSAVMAGQGGRGTSCKTYWPCCSTNEHALRDACRRDVRPEPESFCALRAVACRHDALAHECIQTPITGNTARVPGQLPTVTTQSPSVPGPVARRYTAPWCAQAT